METQDTITIIGGGNIGSSTAYGLAKLGLKSIVVYDFDKVEEHNLASQFYKVQDVGELKVACLAKHIEEFTGTTIVQQGEYKDQPVHGILIVAVDSMSMREKICEAIKRTPPRAIIDGRMGRGTIQIYTRRTPEEYKETLGGAVQNVPCSERHISYTSILMAGLITNQVKRILKDEEYKRNIVLDVDTLRFA